MVGLHRRSLRLRDYDYSQAGAYFITICVHARRSVLGKIANQDVSLSQAGRIAQRVWNSLPVRFPQVGLDVFVVMPNHVHGVLLLSEPVGAGFPRPMAFQSPRRSLGQIIAYFKYQSTRR